MRGFFDRLQWRMAGWMQGRHGADSLSNMLIVVGLVLTLASVVPRARPAFLGGARVLGAGAVPLLLPQRAQARKRERGVPAHRRQAQRAVSVAGKAWKNRKTTCYFKCKKCGTVLTVPRGKGTLRVTCPKCHEQTVRKS